MDENIYGDDGLIIDDKHVPEEEQAEVIKFRKPNRFRRKKTVRLVVLILLLCLITAGAVFGVYKLFFDKTEPYDDSAAYYFYSELLKESGSKLEAVSQIGEISFSIRNFPDDLRISKEKIEDFKLKVSVDGKDITKKVTVNSGEKSMEAGVRSTCEVSVVLPEEYYGANVLVTATSSPIEVVIERVFVVKPVYTYTVTEVEEDEFTLLDQGVDVKLTLTAEEDTVFSVKYDPKKLIVDSTNRSLDEYAQGNDGYLIPVAGGSEVTIVFFKQDVKEIFDSSTKAITVEKSDKYIEPKDVLSVSEEKTEEVEE